MPNDGGGLILSTEEKNSLLDEFPNAKKFIRKLLGSYEFINGAERFCLWIKNEDLDEALQIPFIQQRIEKTKEHRLNSKDAGAKKLASRSHQFRDLNEYENVAIIVPRVSSERRPYIPCGILHSQEVISDSAQAVYDAEYWLMGIISSKMHMIWMRAVGGRLKTDYRYSKDVVYNTFPFPNITQKQKEEITELVFGVLDEREKHTQKTLAQLYDPYKMPEGLRKAHHTLDVAIEQCYRTKPFESDEERLEYLFKMYEEMTSK